jgi:hypothetical protein
LREGSKVKLAAAKVDGPPDTAGEVKSKGARSGDESGQHQHRHHQGGDAPATP